MRKIQAPFTVDEVQALERRQADERCHPYTCNASHGTHSACKLDSHPDTARLIPTTYGWVCQYCNYKQEWCLLEDLLAAPHDDTGDLFAEIVLAAHTKADCHFRGDGSGAYYIREGDWQCLWNLAKNYIPSAKRQQSYHVSPDGCIVPQFEHYGWGLTANGKATGYFDPRDGMNLKSIAFDAGSNTTQNWKVVELFRRKP